MAVCQPMKFQLKDRIAASLELVSSYRDRVFIKVCDYAASR
jgi:hypothetical protein